MINFLIEANSLLRDIVANTQAVDTAVSLTAESVIQSDTTADKSLEELIGADSAQAEAATREEFNLQNPLFGLLNPRVNEQGQPLPSSMVGLAAGIDTAQVNEYLSMNQIKALFPRDLQFRWSQTPYK